MDFTEIIKGVSLREISEQCYNIKIEDIAIYYYVRRPLFTRFLNENGQKVMYRPLTTSKWVRRKARIRSFLQLMKLYIKGKSTKYLIYPFSRTDMVNGEYVDKFTDPLIDYTSLGDDYVIFETGNNGFHVQPRKHRNNIIYTDYIAYITQKLSNRRYKNFYKKHVDEFNALFVSIEKIFPNIHYDKDFIIKKVLSRTIESNIYKKIFKRLKTKLFIAPSRNDFLHIIPAAKQSGVMVYELQHGYVKNNSVTYSGHHVPMFTPDLFLAYGDASITDKYGIDIHKIKVTGWAFDKYLDDLSSGVIDTGKIKVLMIADPIDTEKLINTCIFLAQHNPNIDFYYRAHPGEVLEEKYILKLKTEKNIFIDDNSQNILVTFKSFNHIIGVNSTVLSEAITFDKKVGILYLNGLCPFNTDGSEDMYCWRIDGLEAFSNYINATPSEKKHKKIYSDFNKELFEELINL